MLPTHPHRASRPTGSDVGRWYRGIRWGRLLLTVLLLIGLTAPAVAGDKDENAPPKLKVSELPEYWQNWLENEVYPLISKEQKNAFLSLATDAERKAFANRLWVLWGRQSGLGSAFRQIYEERLQLVRIEFDYPKEDRARVLLIHGPPDFAVASNCPEWFEPLEIWGYSYLEGVGQDVVVLFYRPDGLGSFRMWTDMDGNNALYSVDGELQRNAGLTSRFDTPSFQCPNGDQLVRLIAAARRWSREPRLLQAMYKLPQSQDDSAESASRRFMEFSAILERDAEPLEFSLQEAARGMQGGKIDMGFSIAVPSEQLGRTEVGDVDVVQVDVVGEISREEEMVDRFRYLFSVPAAKDELSFLVERSLRPGEYVARLKVEDVHSKRESVKEQRFRVSAADVPESARPPGVDVAAVDGGLLTELEQEQPVLRLVGPEGEAISGLCRFEAVTKPEVQQVLFKVDGSEILRKNRPPFDVDLNVGPLPRLTTVAAVAYDAEGVELARDELSLNVGRERFYVRVQPLSQAAAEGDRVRVEVEVNTPSERTLERLELYWNDILLATLFQAPFETWVNLERRGEFGYLRALAVLDDGSQAEDFQFVNAPQFGSVVDVTAVELPVTVLDRDGKPVENLTQQDFTVIEDGTVQQISHFALHQDLPVRLGIVIDTSGSMEDTLPDVQRVVMGFLRQLLRPRDRAYIETFSDRPDILAPFTADFGTLENALLALYPDRSTAFYDAVIMGLFQFAGVRGRKAMVILTDGEDTASKTDFDTVLKYAQRNAVTVYTVGIDLAKSKLMIRWQLSRLAEVTGGHAFFLGRKANLERVYEQINHELRSQYLLAYTSNSTKPPEELREIEVEVARKRVKVRTLSGYYPGGL